MKKVIMGLTALIFSTTAVFAQHTEFGLKAGYNAANFTNENGSEYKMKSGFHVGGLAHIHISKLFALQPEVVYSMQGTKFMNNNTDARYNLDYINVPVLLQLMVHDGLRLETGPQVGFLVNAQSKNGNTSVKVKDNFQPTDVSWAFGVGYLTPARLGFDVRYNLGLTDITKSTGSNLHNSVIQAGVFYQFK